MTVPQGRSAAGVTVLLCGGHRCHAVRHRADAAVPPERGVTLLGVLRESVRQTRHAVLIRTDCLGVCARAPAVGVIRPAGSSGEANRGTLFGPVESPAQVRGLLAAVVAGDP